MNCQQLTVAAESANLDKVSNVDKTFDVTDCLTQINKDDKSDISTQTNKNPKLDNILYSMTSWLTSPALPVLTSANKTLIHNVMNFLKEETGSQVKLVNHVLYQNLNLTDCVTNSAQSIN